MISSLGRMGEDLPFSDTNNDEFYSCVSDNAEIDNAVIVVDNAKIILSNSQYDEENYVLSAQLNLTHPIVQPLEPPKIHQNTHCLKSWSHNKMKTCPILKPLEHQKIRQNLRSLSLCEIEKDWHTQEKQCKIRGRLIL